MNTLSKNQIVDLFFSCLLVIVTGSVSAAPLFGDDEDVIWKSGANLYFKFSKQDESTFGKNDHPVDLDAKEISAALEGLRIWDEDEGYTSSVEDVETVFSVSQMKLLGNNLAKGLKYAKPDQDIIFVLEKSASFMLIFTDNFFIAGRVFYQDGRLNIIIGDYDVFQNEELERVYDSSRQLAPYAFNHGFRSQSSSKFKEKILKSTGIDNKRIGNKSRSDWFVIDVKTAAADVLAKKNQKNKSTEGVSDEAIQREAARLAQERRQLRMEMARMRKEMQESTNNKEQLTIEERLARLDVLREKELISEDEYEKKRREILNEI